MVEKTTYNCQMVDFFFSCICGLSLDALREENKKLCIIEEARTKVSILECGP